MGASKQRERGDRAGGHWTAGVNRENLDRRRQTHGHPDSMVKRRV
jgi:hypothetical protein